MLWALHRRHPTVTLPSCILSKLWLAEFLGLDIIRQPGGTKSTPSWLLEPAEVVELLATHAGEEFASSRHWLSTTVLDPTAVGETTDWLPIIGSVLPQTVITHENQVPLWREAVHWYLIGRRSLALGAMKDGFRGIDAPHPLIMQLRALTFSERQEFVSGTETISAQALIEAIRLKEPHKGRAKSLKSHGESITQNFEWLKETLQSDQFQEHLG